MTNRVSRGFGLVCGLAALTVAGAGAVRAEEGMLVKNLLGNMGIIPKEKETIRYRERAPLVVPPKTELRTPAQGAAANPDWPSDPEVTAKRRAAEEARRPATESDVRRMSGNNPRLSPWEMQAGRVASHELSTPGSHRGDNAGVKLTPDELRAGKKSADDGKLANEEPSRRLLTEPPSGLRRSTAKSTPNDFTPKVDQERETSAMSWITRKFTREDDD